MYNIPFLFLLTGFSAINALGGQPTYFHSPPAHRSAETHKPVHVQRMNRGPANEPILPDPVSDPTPATVADRPNDVSLRRRKLNIRLRN